MHPKHNTIFFDHEFRRGYSSQRQRPPPERRLALLLALVCGLASLVLVLVAFGYGDMQTCSFFLGVFIVLELTAIAITCRPVISQDSMFFRKPSELEQVTYFTTAYGSFNNMPTFSHHLPQFSLENRLPPMTPHKPVHLNNVESEKFQKDELP
ncbi:hypothetical protein JTE90_005528 [Oedothorax gibbosus]|uniref:Uncharacterized protein n=1 Tax=Oedothorax gibbosus TaxID=931172 RepID=A0AAV6V9R2_9ARAC|nr:hypothetical protein JTE90_005528 [Oedothorax gibbosus]